MTPVIRQARAEELPYVIVAWTQAAYALSRDKPALYSLFVPLFEGITTRLLKGADVVVATNPDDDEQIFGCIVYRPAPDPALHLVSVKPDFHRHGIAGTLCAAVNVRFDKPAAHTLPIPMRLVRKKSQSAMAARKAWTFVPYGLMP
jgi:hypothetical protein